MVLDVWQNSSGFKPLVQGNLPHRPSVKHLSPND
jgi:hypothetical protein